MSLFLSRSFGDPSAVETVPRAQVVLAISPRRFSSRRFNRRLGLVCPRAFVSSGLERTVEMVLLCHGRSRRRIGRPRIVEPRVGRRRTRSTRGTAKLCSSWVAHLDDVVEPVVRYEVGNGQIGPSRKGLTNHQKNNTNYNFEIEQPPPLLIPLRCPPSECLSLSLRSRRMFRVGSKAGFNGICPCT